MQTIELELIDPAPRNANVMSEAMLVQLTNNMAEDPGTTLQPVLVRPKAGGRYEIVDGHHRVEAARRARWAAIDAVVYDDMTDEEAARAAIAMNRLRGQLDLGLVGEAFAELAEAGVDPELLTATGFSADEVDALIRAATEHPDDEVPPEMERPADRGADEGRETWDLEVSFAERRDRDRVRRTARKVGGGDPAAGLLRLVDAEEGEGDLELLLEVASPLADWAAGQDEACELAEKVQRLVKKINKRRGR